MNTGQIIDKRLGFSRGKFAGVVPVFRIDVAVLAGQIATVGGIPNHQRRGVGRKLQHLRRQILRVATVFDDIRYRRRAA